LTAILVRSGKTDFRARREKQKAGSNGTGKPVGNADELFPITQQELLEVAAEMQTTIDPPTIARIGAETADQANLTNVH
jgi:hypothetical protein